MPVETPVDDDAGPASVPVLEAFEFSPSADIVGGYNSLSSKSRLPTAGRDAYFTISSASIDVLFRKVRYYLMLENLHFHDSRADALTRMARKMDVMTLARVSGHRDLRQLLDAYFRESASDIAKRI